MDNQPSIAIVILNWNGINLLKEFLPSVLQHSQYPNTTIYVADNASTDDSINYLTSTYHDRVAIIRNTGNYGYAKGYNEALKDLSEDYFILLNSDVEVTANWLDPMMHMMTADTNIAACQPKLLQYTNKEYFEYAGACGGFVDKHGYPFCRGRIFDSFEKDEHQYDNEMDIFWASGACLVIRSQLFFEAKGFEEDFFAHMEEIDLCWRLKQMGYTIKVCPSSTVYHLGGGTLQKMNPRKTYLNFRNNRLMVTKNIASNRFLVNFIFRDIMDIIAIFQALAYGKFKESYAILKAFIDFHLMLPKWLKKRKTLKAKLSPQQLSKTYLYPKSIVFQYFVKHIKHYKDLK